MLRPIARISFLLAFCALLPTLGLGQQTSRAMLDTSEALFSVVTAINACGYDQELSSSEPLRAQVRAEVARATSSNERARASLEALCAFYREHQAADSSRDLAQYVSLALHLGEAPAFAPTVKEADLPPDASYVLGFIPLLQRFYINAELQKIWERHKPEYDGFIERFSSSVSNTLLTTDVYLKMPVSGYLGRRFVIYVEPMAGPGQVNSRNYGSNYYIVLSPERGALRMDSIRHTYLHFTLDPLLAKRGSSLNRLAPLLDSVKTAPMQEHFKKDITLLLTESMIRAIESRTSVVGTSKDAESKREKLAQTAAGEGFVLSPFFEKQLGDFEKSPESLRDALPNWLVAMDLGAEQKRAKEIVFANAATPESLQATTRQSKMSLLDQAEGRLSAGDLKQAAALAQQALDQKQEDAGKALFILAQIATQNRDLAGAQGYFEQAIAKGREPRQLAWSHIYLGRILDLQEEREAALEHYRAALAAGDTNPATRSAAERGLQQPYAAPVNPNQDSKEK